MMVSREKLSFGYFTLTLDKNHLNLTKKLSSTEYLKANYFQFCFLNKKTNCNYKIFPSLKGCTKELKTISVIFTRFATPTFCDDFKRDWKLFDPLSANPTKWSNTLKQFVGYCLRIIWVKSEIWK